MSFNCELIQKDRQPVVLIKAHTPVQELPTELGKAFAALGQYLGEISETPVGPPFVAYYNQDIKNLEIEIGFPVMEKVAGKGEIQSTEIPAGQFASCLYIGPYPGLASAYDALTAWVGKNGYTPSGVSYEYYLNDPGNTAPDELQTQIEFPLI